MALRLVQAGSGDSRPLVFVVHFAGGSAASPHFIDDRIRAAVSRETCVVGYTAPVPAGKGTTGGAYREIGAAASDGGRFPDLLQVCAWATAHGAGAVHPWGPVVVAGFSEGGQGVRAWLGEPIAAFLAVDGVHASKPPDEASQIAPWRERVKQARAGTFRAVYTYSQIDPPSFLAVRETLRLILGLAPMPPGKVFEAGGLRVSSFGGNDAGSHAFQLQAVLPIELYAVAKSLGFGGDAEKLAGLLGGGCRAPADPVPANPAASSCSSPLVWPSGGSARIFWGAVVLVGVAAAERLYAAWVARRA